jgi:uncharacterized membrane protein YedE/YeeE
MKQPPEQAILGDAPRQLALGLLFGIAFGFLLQKGGVAKFEVLIGALLLQDYTVIEVMLSAIIVGMAGVFTLNRFGLVQLKLKPTKYGANIIGGLIFGAGFALAAYCPGTGAAALGQGNFDALAVIAGLVAGSYLYALNSAWLGRTVGKWGNRGELTLAGLVHQPNWLVAAIVCLVLIGVLALLSVIPALPPPIV